MIKLIYNELYKIFHKKVFYVMLIISFVLILGEGYLAKFIRTNMTESTWLLEDRIENVDKSSNEGQVEFADASAQLEIMKLCDKEGTYSLKCAVANDSEALDHLTKYYLLVAQGKGDSDDAKEERANFDEVLKKYDGKEFKDFYGDRADAIKKQIEEAEAVKTAFELAVNSDLLPEEFEGIDLKEIDIDQKKKEYNDALETLKVTLSGYEYLRDVNKGNNETNNILTLYAVAYSNYKDYNPDDSAYKDNDSLYNKRMAEREYYKYKYMIDNRIVNDDTRANRDEMILPSLSAMNGFVLIFAIILVAGIICDEFNKGTIKQLLIKPFERSKILTSKVIACTLVILLFNLLYYGVVYVAASIPFGFNFDSVLYYSFNTHSIGEMNLLVYMFINTICLIPQLLFYTALCLLFGVLFTNLAISFIGGFAVYLFAPLFSAFVGTGFNTKIWISYIPIFCFNFNEFLFGGNSHMLGQTFWTNIASVGLSTAVMITIVYIIFKRKNIKNQ